MNRYAIIFRWVVVLGVLANLSMAIPGVFIPNAVIDAVGGTPLVGTGADYLVWPSFASLLLVLLSLFYLPAAADPFAYRPVAVLAVLARAAGAIFFLGAHRVYAVFGYLDLAFGVVEGILLAMAYAVGPPIPGQQEA